MSIWWKKTLLVIALVAVLALLAWSVAHLLGYRLRGGAILAGAAAGLGGWLLSSRRGGIDDNSER